MFQDRALLGGDAPVAEGLAARCADAADNDGIVLVLAAAASSSPRLSGLGATAMLRLVGEGRKRRHGLERLSGRRDTRLDLDRCDPSFGAVLAPLPIAAGMPGKRGILALADLAPEL